MRCDVHVSKLVITELEQGLERLVYLPLVITYFRSPTALLLYQLQDTLHRISIQFLAGSSQAFLGRYKKP